MSAWIGRIACPSSTNGKANCLALRAMSRFRLFAGRGTALSSQAFDDIGDNARCDAVVIVDGSAPMKFTSSRLRTRRRRSVSRRRQADRIDILASRPARCGSNVFPIDRLVGLVLEHRPPDMKWHRAACAKRVSGAIELHCPLRRRPQPALAENAAGLSPVPPPSRMKLLADRRMPSRKV